MFNNFKKLYFFKFRSNSSLRDDTRGDWRLRGHSGFGFGPSYCQPEISLSLWVEIFTKWWDIEQSTIRNKLNVQKITWEFIYQMITVMLWWKSKRLMGECRFPLTTRICILLQTNNPISSIMERWELSHNFNWNWTKKWISFYWFSDHNYRK